MKKIFIPAAMIVLTALHSCNGGNDSNPEPEDIQNVSAPVNNISYSVINTYPHDTSSFTQGLIVYKGQMYEGTGGSDANPVSSKQSRLMKIDLKTGNAQKSVQLPGNFFGEGITILNDTLYQLTWTNKVVFVYSLPEFKKIREIPINTDGWGITNNGKELIVSDGSSNLFFYEPSTFRLMRTQSVTNNGEPVGNINELEFIDGFVYANQWGANYIYKIDPNDGQIKGVIDLTQLAEKSGIVNDPDRVLNGIAYDTELKKIYVTGKKWPQLFEIQLGQ